MLKHCQGLRHILMASIALIAPAGSEVRAAEPPADFAKVTGRWEPVKGSEAIQGRNICELRKNYCGLLEGCSDEEIKKRAESVELMEVAMGIAKVVYEILQMGPDTIQESEIVYEHDEEQPAHVHTDKLVNCRYQSPNLIICPSEDDDKTRCYRLEGELLYLQGRLSKRQVGCETNANLWIDFFRIQEIAMKRELYRECSRPAASR